MESSIGKKLSDGIFSGSTIKIIALISMITDHIGANVVANMGYPLLTEIMRQIGRISFPLFCFLLVEGFVHTKSFTKYLVRLGVFALISEIPFDMARSGRFILEFRYQNVFFTLFLSLIVLFVIDKYEKNVIIQCVAVAAGCAVAYFIKCDYSYFGILQVVVFYYFRQLRLPRILSVTCLNLLKGQPAGIVSLIFSELYNGKRGLKLKYLFYVIYPAHLLAIYFVRIYLL